MNIKKDILSTLCYFDIFLYPLNKKELFIFLPNRYDAIQFENAVADLLLNSIIFKAGEFLSLQNTHSIFQRRMKGNRRAKDLLRVAEKVGVLLSLFPYVKGVAVSGSLSKDFADEDDDIDLFIITGKNRVWITRSLLFGFRRLAGLINKQKWFCMNYFIDEQMLEIPEKNIYTATEIVTLLPLQGLEVFKKFYSANTWTKTILPNSKVRTSSRKQIKGSLVKSFSEKLLNNFFGDWLENFLMKATAKRLQKKEHFLKNNTRGMLVIEKHIARHDPKIFQRNFMSKYEIKVSEIMQQYRLLSEVRHKH